jgi:hypothetical protein
MKIIAWLREIREVRRFNRRLAKEGRAALTGLGQYRRAAALSDRMILQILARVGLSHLMEVLAAVQAAQAAPPPVTVAGGTRAAHAAKANLN